ncbi:serine/threonine kinase [alpha proteobacterium U9-1i]|nr:serine/threonine kinase [alpha proteobacterium U9-1i]
MRGVAYAWSDVGWQKLDDAWVKLSPSADDPVRCVSWDDARAYLKWLNAKLGLNEAAGYRLPSETEWEFAQGSGAIPARDGLWEWCEDLWHPSRDLAPVDGSAWTLGGLAGVHVNKGGGHIFEPGAVRRADRNGNAANMRSSVIGFRVARTMVTN